ncbi:hypothetical protein [Pseudomonas putida]|uniref:hypothetical protein n=1 Tax=Pseudomonas putida TaxID=303 RepID=UPI000465B19A|nr:hypothetical protein [Pseudomonas putida]
MQPHQQTLALGIVWLATLVVMPFLFATARRRAHALGFMEGQEVKEAAHAHRVRQLERDLADKQAELDTARKAFTAHMEVRREVIAEPEERIMPYTGLPVTRADYDLLISATETLNLAEKTWRAAPGAEPWRYRAAKQEQDIQALAMRIHFQLRSTPATAANMETAV